MCLTTKLNTYSFLTIKSNIIAIGKKEQGLIIQLSNARAR